MALRAMWLEALWRQALAADDVERQGVWATIFRHCAVFPGREGLPRSLGSVNGAAVARFLPGNYAGRCRGVVYKGSDTLMYSIAVSCTRRTLLVVTWQSKCRLAAYALNGKTPARTAVRAVVFRHPRVVAFSPDNVAYCNHGNQIETFTPRLKKLTEFRVHLTGSSSGLCVGDDHVFLLEAAHNATNVVAFARRDGARSFCIAVPEFAMSMCLLPCLGQRCVALCYDYGGDVLVYSVDGALVRRFKDVDGLSLHHRASSDELLAVDGAGGVTALQLDDETSRRRIAPYDDDVEMEAFAHCGDTTFMAGESRVVAFA
jgi:hypothetical protein